MGLIATLEKWLEKAIEGFFNRGFRGKIQPIEIAKRLGKEMENNKTISISKVYVPNYYLVHLSSEDGEKMKAFQQALSEELSEYLLNQGIKAKYIFLSGPEVSFAIDDSLSSGQIRLESRFTEGKKSIEDNKEVTDPKIQPIVSQTTQIFSTKEMFRQEQGELLVVKGPDQGKKFILGKETMIIGRKRTNEIYLNDSNVSRCHAKVEYQDGIYNISDLGSTNGTLVNGELVTNIILSQDDTIEVGKTTLIFKVV